MDMWTTALWVLVVALVWLAWVSGEVDDGGGGEVGGSDEDDENMRTLRRVLSWHAERIGRLEAELQLQEARARRRLNREGFSRSTGSL